MSAILICYALVRVKQIQSVEDTLTPAYEFLCRQWKPLVMVWLAIVGIEFLLFGNVFSGMLILILYLVAPNREIEKLPF